MGMPDPFAQLKNPLTNGLAKNLVALPLLVAKSKREPGLGPDGKIAADLTYGDYSAERIRKLRWLFKLDWMEIMPARYYFFSLRAMANGIFSTGDLQHNIQKMIDHFESSKGTDYSSDELNKAVRTHARYVEFKKDVDSHLHAGLQLHKGDLSQFSLNREMSITSPLLFNTSSDKIHGLTIAINDVWAWRVEILEYALQGKTYSGRYRVTMYDHFGLDEPDVDTSKIYGNLEGFRAWFILQHYTRFAYKPFITKIPLEENFMGQLP